jgi:hypothetical protein
MERRAVPGSFLGGAASLRWCVVFWFAVAFPFIAASLRRSLKVFSNDTGATTVCIGGATS